MDTTIASSASAATGELLQLTRPEPTSESATSSILDDNKECSRDPIAMPYSDRLCQLPRETRFRIYDFLFVKPVLRFTHGSHDCPPVFEIQDFPIKIMNTNRLLHYELEQYIPNFVKVRLWTFYHKKLPSRLEPIPQRYIRLIGCLETDDMTRETRELHHTMIHELPNLRHLNISQGNNVTWLSREEPREWHNATIELNGKQAADHVEKCFEIIDPPIPLLDGCRNRGINILYRFRVGYANIIHWISIHTVHTVEVSKKGNGEPAYRLVAKVYKAPLHMDSREYSPETEGAVMGCNVPLLDHHHDMLNGVLSSANLMTPFLWLRGS
jgi:hypothetical protein